MLNQPTIFKTPIAISQTQELCKGCSSGYVTNVIYTPNGPKNETCSGTFSCSPYGGSYIDASKDPDGWTIVGAISGVVGAVASLFT